MLLSGVLQPSAASNWRQTVMVRSVKKSTSDASHPMADAHASGRARLNLEVLFAVARDVVQVAAAGDMSSAVKLLAREGDKVLNKLVGKELGANKRDRSYYEANAMLSWFLRQGTNVDHFLDSSARHSDHSFGTMFEALLQQAPAAHHLRIVQTYMAWVADRPGLTQHSGLKVQTDPTTHEELWLWPTGKIVDEAALPPSARPSMTLPALQMSATSSWPSRRTMSPSS